MAWRRRVILGLLLLGAIVFVAGRVGDSTVQVAVCLGGVLVLVTTLLWPEITVLGLLFLLYTRISDLYRPDTWLLSLNQLIMGLFLVAVVTRRLLDPGRALVLTGVLLWMLAYGGAIALSSLQAVDPPATFAALSAHLREVLILFVLINLLSSAADLRRATWVLVAGGIVLSLAGLAHLATGQTLGGLSSVNIGQIAGNEIGPRLAGTIGNANAFAQLLVSAVPLALYRAWCERRRALRLIALAATSLLAVVIMWTYSRAGALALMGALGAAVALQRCGLKYLPAPAFVLGVVVLAAPHAYWDRAGALLQFASGAGPRPGVAGVSMTPAPDSVTVPLATSPAIEPSGALTPGQVMAAPASPSFDEAARSTPDYQSDTPVLPDGSLIDRSKLWQVGMRMFLDHPLTGVGKGNYLELYPRYYRQVDPALGSEPLVSHSTPVQIAAETGLVGLATYAAVIVTALLGLRNGKLALARAGLVNDAKLLEAVELAIWTGLVTSLFMSDDFPRSIWLPIGLGVIGSRIALQSAQARSGPQVSRNLDAVPPAPGIEGEQRPKEF